MGARDGEGEGLGELAESELWSGGGVGGKTFLLFGGSDCCLLLWRPGLTRLVAAKDMLSAGRSSLVSVFDAARISAPAKPVNALARSDAATSLALPR